MHESVLLNEAIDALNLNEKSVVVDMTLGFAGHSSEILKRIKKGYLFAFDQDEEAITYSTKKLSTIGSNFEVIDSNFAYLKDEMAKRNIAGVDAILYDLGVSSPQLDQDYRGFSYHKDAILDMRMDQDNSLTARIVVNTYSQDALCRIFKDYGESKFAGAIAKNIVKRRAEKEIATTLELVEIIKEVIPIKERLKKHPARQIFQAIRMEVNHEMEVLEVSLNDAIKMLNVGGRLAVITFHSLEDRFVKQKFKSISEVDEMLKGMPGVDESLLPDYKIVARVRPTDKEIDKNKRAHSAILRVIERIK